MTHTLVLLVSPEIQKSGHGVTRVIGNSAFCGLPRSNHSFSTFMLPAPCLNPVSVHRFLDLKRQHPEVISDLQFVIIVHHEFCHVR